jgi:hypothetical protein
MWKSTKNESPFPYVIMKAFYISICNMDEMEKWKKG